MDLGTPNSFISLSNCYVDIRCCQNYKYDQTYVRNPPLLFIENKVINPITGGVENIR